MPRARTAATGANVDGVRNGDDDTMPRWWPQVMVARGEPNGGHLARRDAAEVGGPLSFPLSESPFLFAGFLLLALSSIFWGFCFVITSYSSHLRPVVNLQEMEETMEIGCGLQKDSFRFITKARRGR
ncbi:type III PLP-dependent enzyme [Sesbania bispinosa]|nr:type III PLP-dependent enzyme [Sesbania bispinosa]